MSEVFYSRRCLQNQSIRCSEARDDELILGRDFLADTDVSIRRGRIEVKRLPAESIDIFVREETINDTPDQSVSHTGFKELIAINYVASEKIEVAQPYRNRIKAMITAHRPQANVKTMVETRIILKNQILVHHRPRRLAQKEKDILDSQINESG